MQIVFYKTPAGQEPVREYLVGLPLRDRAAAADVLDAIREHGLKAPGVRFKAIRGKLWEFYVEAGASHRVFYVVVTGSLMVLLHAYKKQAQKAPAREIDVAERRMKEVRRGT
jgi:phage-related protein